MNSKKWAKADYTKVNGTKRLGKEMGWEFSFGKMGLNMKVYGLETRPTAREE